MDSSDENEEYTSWRGVPGIIILINMYDKESATVSHAAACCLIKQYLRLSGSNNVGVCLYGIENKSSNADVTNFEDVFSLTTPTLDDFTKLRDLDLNAVIPAKDLILSDILWHCSKMFANFKKQLSTRTVIMMTKLDTPPVASDQNPTFTRVVDLANSNVDLKIIHVAKEDNINSFYEEFLLEANKGNEFKLPKSTWDTKYILGQLYQQSNRHLAVARLDFEIGDGISIGVGIYNLLNSQKYSSHKKLDRETNALLTTDTKTMKCSVSQTNENATTSADSESKLVPLLKSEIVHYQTLGGEKIQFTDTEKKMLGNPFGTPMMKLLGFKPATVVCKEKWFLKQGQFLFPNESKIEGSTVAFKALHKACTEMKVVAICVLITRANSKPKIVALAPCSRPLNLDVEIGFDVIILPYAENVRDLLPEDNEDVPIISEAQKKLMENVISKLKFHYKPDMFENPTKEMEYRAIEAIALDQEDIERFVDTTKPSPENFQNLNPDLFMEIFGPFSVRPAKRNETSESGPKNKRVKKENTTENVDRDLLNERFTSNTVDKYTVPQLKEVLYSLNHPECPALTGLNKKKLVELVYQYFN